MQAAKRSKRSASGNRKGPRGTSVQFMLPFAPTQPPPRPPEPKFNPHYVGFPFGAPPDAE